MDSDSRRVNDRNRRVIHRRYHVAVLSIYRRGGPYFILIAILIAILSWLLEHQLLAIDKPPLLQWYCSIPVASVCGTLLLLPLGPIFLLLPLRPILRRLCLSSLVAFAFSLLKLGDLCFLKVAEKQLESVRR